MQAVRISGTRNIYEGGLSGSKSTTMSLAFAAESWVLAILGWVWLTVQDMMAWSLLSACVVYGLLLVSTCHLLATAAYPDGRQFKRAFFGFVLALTLFSASCVVDAMHGTPLWGDRLNATTVQGCCSNCDNARTNKLLFFTDSSFYLVQAGVTLGYLIVHLLLAGVPMLDPLNRTLWPGPAFGTALATLLAARLFIVFQGSILTIAPSSSIYVLLFSMPLVSLSFIYFWFMLALASLMATEGVSGLNRTGLQITRCLTLGMLLMFVGVSMAVLQDRRMLTLGFFAGLAMPIFPAIFGVVEAFAAQDPPAEPWPQSRRARAMAGARVPHYIPIPIQVEGGKKGV